jgi:hypothetical protein
MLAPNVWPVGGGDRQFYILCLAFLYLIDFSFEEANGFVTQGRQFVLIFHPFQVFSRLQSITVGCSPNKL